MIEHKLNRILGNLKTHHRSKDEMFKDKIIERLNLVLNVYENSLSTSVSYVEYKSERNVLRKL